MIDERHAGPGAAETRTATDRFIADVFDGMKRLDMLAREVRRSAHASATSPTPSPYAGASAPSPADRGAVVERLEAVFEHLLKVVGAAAEHAAESNAVSLLESIAPDRQKGPLPLEMSDDPETRRAQREATDRFISALSAGLEQLNGLADEVNRARDIDADLRSTLPAGEAGDTIREWLDGYDRIADGVQDTCEHLARLLEEAATHAATTEVYLHRLAPQVQDPRQDG